MTDAAMNIKTKIELKSKGEKATLPTVEQLVVDLKWKSALDLDLMAFIEKKDGTTHGVFTDNLDGDMGSLNSFPYMTLSGDAGVGAVAGQNVETLKITKIADEIAKIHLVALNYTDAANKTPGASFNGCDGMITVQGAGEAFDIILGDKSEGTAAIIATIDNTGVVGATIENRDCVTDLRGLVETVPGAIALTN